MTQREASSFRDRSGYIFYDSNAVYRSVHHSYKSNYDRCVGSGLYELLIASGSLVAHKEVAASSWPSMPSGEPEPYKVLEVERIPYISYPYEWCFQQLKDAALLTLDIQLKALQHNLSLKDASSFNIQFSKGKPVFIDTLSFEEYQEGKPWVAYRQFCTHFLAPLSLISKSSRDLRRMSQLFIDGVPLSVASELLPYKTRLSAFFQIHIHYHAKLEQKYAADTTAGSKLNLKLSKNRLEGIIRHLASGIRSLSLPAKKTEWASYYQEFSYSDAAIQHKKQLVRDWTSASAAQHVWDLGCNAGRFSMLVQPLAKQVTAFDIDHLAIEELYRTIKQKRITNLLPLVLDLSNPTAAIGWANNERKSFVERGPANLILALALIHHLAIGNNLPLSKIGELFYRLTDQWLIVEFVPKEDEQTRRLLVTREDVFTDYNQKAFEASFASYFTITRSEKVKGTERTLYLMQRR